MKTRVTIEFLEPAEDGTMWSPRVMEFDHLDVEQSRPVHTTFNPQLGGAVTLTPDRTTTTVLTGTKTAPSQPAA